jgi:alpha-N-arabinofuranosidase
LKFAVGQGEEMTPYRSRLETFVMTFAAAAAVLVILPARGPAHARVKSDEVNLKVFSSPLHDGRISPMLYGGFVELLNDHVPGMWAEMLGDRGFEGVLPTSTWDYFRGEPDLCDRDWDRGPDWSYDTDRPFNDRQSCRLDVRPDRPARLTQSGLAVRKGMAYPFSGWWRGSSPASRLRVSLKVGLPDGTWMTLAAADIAGPGPEWRKFSGRLASRGTTDRAVFEVEARGAGPVWLDKLSLMPEDNLDGWRRDVVQAMKELGPPILRWGGSTVDPGPYRWAEAIGDRDARPSFVNRVWGRRDTNDVGVEEFVRLCRIVGAEPLVCVSLGDGVENARHLVEYLNGAPASEWGRRRAANGRTEPYRVKYFQVGNEIEAAGYVKALAEFVRAIHDVDPGALVVSSFPTEEIVAEVGPELAVLAPHYYQPDLEGVDSDLKRIEGWIDASPERGRLKVGVTEWNIDAGDWGLGRGKLNTLRCALFEAQFLNQLHRHADYVVLACRSNMTNSFCAGTIQTNAAGLYRTPGFLNMEMYRKHSKPVPLRVAADVPARVDVSACATEDRAAVTLFLVNTRPEPVRVVLDLSELGPGFGILGGEVVKDSQDRRQADIVNGFADPNRVVRVRVEGVSGNEAVLPPLSITALDCGCR